MKKITLYLLFLCLLVVPFAEVMATEPVTEEIAFSEVTRDGFEASMKVEVAVFDERPGYDCERNNQDRWVLRYRDNPEAFQGAKIYALGTQKDWRGGKPAARVLTNNALALAEVDGPCVTFRFKNRCPNERACDQIVVWYIVLKNGHKGWFGHPGWPNGPYVVYNKNDEPQTMFIIDNVKNHIWPPDNEAKENARKRR